MTENNGFLTGTDKEFLRGEREYTGENAKQNRYERRQAIAERARQAFADFALLFDTLDEHERNRIFDTDVDGEVPVPTEGLRSDLTDTVAFLYLALEGEINSEVATNRRFSFPFDSLLDSAIRRAERARYDRRIVVEFEPPEVSVRTNIDAAALESAIDKLARHSYSELTQSEMFSVLYRFGELHGEESYSRLAERVQDRRAELDIDEREPWDVREMFSDLGDTVDE